jgi:hypothetical protein
MANWQDRDPQAEPPGGSPRSYMTEYKKSHTPEETRGLLAAMTKRGAGSDEEFTVEQPSSSGMLMDHPRKPWDDSEFTVEQPPSNKLQGATEEYSIEQPPDVAPTGAKEFHPGQILDFVATPLDPEMKKDVLGEPPKSTVDHNAPFHPGQIIGGIGDAVKQELYDIGGMVMDALSTPMTWLTPGMVGPSRLGKLGQVVPPLVGEAPQAVDQAALDAMVATRKHNGLRPEFPDRESVLPPAPGMTIRPGSNDITVPGLEPGLHTEYSRYPRGPKTLRLGEYGPEEQMELLRIPQEGGKRLVGPEDQLDIFEQPLRGSVQFRQVPQVRDPLTIEGSYDLQHGRALDAGENVPPRYRPNRDRPVPDIPLDQYSFSDAEFERIMAEPPNPPKPVDVKLSKSGLSASVGDEASYTLPDFTIDDVAPGHNGMPGKYARGFRDTLSAMERIGPAGEEGAHIIKRANAQAGVQTSTEMRTVEKGLDEIFGPSGWWRRKGVAMEQWLGGENAAIHGSRRRWNITEQEMESIYNTMYSGGRIPPINERVQRATRLMFERGTFPASSDPAVRGLRLEDPFTGKEVRMGEPSMFMPQTPIKEMAVKAISDKHWHIMYERMGGQDGLGVSFEKYRDTIIAISKRDPEISSFKMKGLETKRLLDLEALGGSPYQWAKKLGYESDFYRGVYRFNRLAHLRGRFAEIEEPLNQLVNIIQDGAGREWMRAASQRALLNNTDKDLLAGTAKFLRGLSELTDITMLQSGVVGNTTQVIYPISRAGVSNGVKGMFNLLTGRDNEVIMNSGALLPQVLNEMVHPQGPMARWSSAAFKGFGISKIDRFTRWFAGHVGNSFIKSMEGSLLKNPTNKRIISNIEELGGNAKDILAQGKIPDNMRYEMIQNFANNTAGVTDVRGIPLYATNENPLFRLVNKYKSFAQANFAEINRLVSDSPNGLVAARRITTLLAGAQVAGGGVNLLRDQISTHLMGGQKNPDKSLVRILAENEVLGLGALPGLLIVQAANTSAAQFLLGIAGGPAAGRTAGFLEDLYATGKNGVGWRSVDTASRSLPVPLSPMVLGPIVKGQVKKEAKRTAEKTRRMHDYDDD